MFSDENHQKNSRIFCTLFIILLARIAEVNLAKLSIQTQEENRSLEDEAISSRFLSCDVSGDGCRLSCFLFYDNAALVNHLEVQYKICGRALDLTLSMGSAEKINESFLKGNFLLESLTFDNCFIDDFGRNNFNKSSLRSLKTLKLLRTIRDRIDRNAFVGLSALTHFQWSIDDLLTPSDSRSFLQPIAATLETTIIGHATTASPLSNAYYIENWFDGANFTRVKYADFRNNKFTYTLNRRTFSNLPNVEELILSKCEINYLEPDTFDDLLGTLRLLDLSNNKLIRLDNHLVANMMMQSDILTVALHGNPWMCTCDQYDFINGIQNQFIKYNSSAGEPMCNFPDAFKGLAIKSIRPCCNDEMCSDETTSVTETFTTEMPSTASTTNNDHGSGGGGGDDDDLEFY